MGDLTKLKNEVLDELIKVTDEEGLEPQEKFELLLSRYVNDGDQALLSDALTAAKAIEDVTVKGQALMQLLEEIDIAQLDAASEQAVKDEAGTVPSTSVDN